MSEKESIKIRIKRIQSLIEITLIDIAIFYLLLRYNLLDYFKLESFVSSFIEITGVLLGLTFTSYAIILGIVKSIKYSIRKTNAFGAIGSTLFYTAICEVSNLTFGLLMLSLRNLSAFYSFFLGAAFILFSIMIISYVLLILYYMTLLFHSLRSEE
jgi:hypothetical protein